MSRQGGWCSDVESLTNHCSRAGSRDHRETERETETQREIEICKFNASSRDIEVREGVRLREKGRERERERESVRELQFNASFS